MGKKFKLRESGFKKIKKKTFFKAIVFLPISLCLCCYVTGVETFDQALSDDFFLLMLGLMIVSNIIGTAIGMKRKKKTYDSYELIIDNEKIIRRQNGTLSVETPFSEVKEITKDSIGGLTIHSQDPVNSIVVSADLEDVDTLESILSKIVDIKLSNQPIIQHKSIFHKSILPIFLVAIVFMFMLLIATNRYFVSMAAIALTTGLMYAIAMVLQSKVIDKATKKRSLRLYLIILSIVIIVTYFKFFQ